MKKGPHLNVLETSVIMEFFALVNELNSIIKTEQYVFFLSVLQHLLDLIHNRFTHFKLKLSALILNKLDNTITTLNYIYKYLQVFK